MKSHPFSTLKHHQAEFLESLLDENVKFLIVGGYAMRCLGYLRPTEDLDIVIAQSAENPRALQCAIERLSNRGGHQIADLMLQPEKKLTWYNVEVFSSMRELPYEQVESDALNCAWNSKTVSHISHQWMIKAKVLALGAPERSAKRNVDEKDLAFLHSQKRIVN
jgi:hypothetical protein